ncbi:OLC1v1022517C1 [Oldenlandia corymbosa var. corymbosa]|uniref:OLC1v1022517C1 n=1 Tax=Oldenlandia corymbosa var. corymbosa TaxID=529605 RepID=A0AAV1BZJ1_OLDCO|nr:OLC1v1022517C1 [Oldenlandia corymbosa var. corymbosa]
MDFAHAGCVLRVDMGCEGCKYKMFEVLHSVIGVYNVDMDGENGLIRVSGEVDPNMLLQALARYGRHGEVVRVNFKHPEWTRVNNFLGVHGFNSSSLGCNFPRSLSGDHYSPIFSSDYPIRSSGLGCELPRRRHVPLYSRGYNYCNCRTNYFSNYI